MCGIIGVLRFGELGNVINRESAIFLGVNLLEITENRGKDATGVVSLFDDGNIFGQKMGTNATEFISRFGGKESDFDAYTTVLRQYKSSMRVMIGHCRKKSVGGAFDNVNNHPIKTGNIVGVHNGTLTNHEVIFKNLKCKRDGDVDSEAIFRLLEHFTNDCKEPFTLDILQETTKRLNGTFSILAINANNPNQVVSARDTRPAEYCLIKPLGIVLIASEKKFFESVLWKYNQMSRLFNIDKFVKLKASDLEYASLPDDSIALFDLTKEITVDTKLSDLYNTQKCEPTIRRIWKDETTTATVYSGGYYGRAAHTNDVKNNIIDVVSNKDEKTDTIGTKQYGGKLWDAKLGKFVTVTDDVSKVATDVAEKTTVVDIEKKTTTTPVDAAKEVIKDDDYNVEDSFFKVSCSSEDCIDADKAVISCVTVTTKESTKLLTDIKQKASTGKEKSQDEIDAQKAAIEAAKDISKFENAEELAEMCNTDVHSIEKITIVALANRIVKSMFATVFKKGWLSKCAAIEAEDCNSKKVSNAQKHVRVLKGITEMLSEAAAQNKEDLPNYITNWAKNLPINSEITSMSIKTIYNAGDFRNNQILKTATIALEESNK